MASTAVAAARPGEASVQPADHLGRAWTPAPAALFIIDQLGHLGVALAGWAALLATAPLQPGWISAVDRFLGGWDRTAVHDVAAVGVVLAVLAIVNVRAAAIFVAILVRPVEASADDVRWGGRAAPAVDAGPAAAEALAAPAPRGRWAIRVGPVEAHIRAEADVEASPRVAVAPVASSSPPTRTASVGATIGILERILSVVFVLTGSEAAIGFVVAAKTLARFRLLDDRDFAEYYLLGTLASVAVAIITSLIARAALGALLA